MTHTTTDTITQTMTQPVFRAARAMATLALLAALGGCVASDPVAALATTPASYGASSALSPGASALDAPTAHSIARDVPVGAARAALPTGAGEPVAVTERRTDGAIVQTIALAGDATTRGQNHVAVTTRAGRMVPVDARAIRAELAKAFPGTPMGIGATMRRNAYGPFGLASERRTSARSGGCHYAWQRVAAGRADWRGRGVTTLDLRVRLCREGLTTEGAARLMEGLRLNGIDGSAMAAVVGAGFALPAAPVR